MDPFMEDNNTSSGFDPLELLRKFWRRKWLFFIPFVLCLTMAWVAIKVMTPIYYSSAQIRVIHEATQSRLINDGSRGYRRNLDREAMVNIQTIITSPKFLEKISRELNLHQTWMGGRGQTSPTGNAPLSSEAETESIRRTANILRRFVRIEQDGAHLFSIGARGLTPQEALVLARTVLDQFLEEEQANRIASRASTRDFLESQRVIYQGNLDTAELALTNFQRNMLSASLAGNPVNYQNLADAEEALNRLRDQFYNADVNEEARLERQARLVLPDLPSGDAFSRDAEIVSLLRELTDLEFSQLLAGAASFGGGTLDRSNDLGRLRVRLNTQVQTRFQQQYPQLGVLDRSTITEYFYFVAYRQINQRLINRLTQNISEFREFTTMQPEQSAELNRLQSDVTSARELLMTINREITQQTMNLEASMSEIGYRIEVRQDPQLPRGPIEPNKLKLAFMGFFLSIALGGGLVVLAIMLDRSFNSVPEIEQTLGLPVIGTLPVIQDDHFERKRKMRLLKWTTIVLVILAVAAVGLLVVYPRVS